MFKSKFLFSSGIFAVLFIVSLFIVSFPQQVQAGTLQETASSTAATYAQAKTASEKANLDLAALKVSTANLKAISDAAKKLSELQKTEVAKTTANTAKVEYDNAVKVLGAAVKIANDAKQLMMTAEKAAKKAKFAYNESLLITSRIKCVGDASIARENSLTAPKKTYDDAVQAAYKTRLDAITSLYGSAKTMKEVKDGNKAIWKAFNDKVKAAATAWRTAHVKAWTAYNAAVKVCKSPPDFVDSTYMSSEAK